MWLVWEVMISPEEYPTKQSCLTFSSTFWRSQGYFRAESLLPTSLRCLNLNVWEGWRPCHIEASCAKRSVQSCAEGKHRRVIYQTAPTPIWHASAVVENLPSCSPNQAEVPILPLRSLRHIMTLAFNAITCFGLLSKPHWNNAIRAWVGVVQWSSRIFQPWPFYSYTDLCVSPVSLQIL